MNCTTGVDVDFGDGLFLGLPALIKNIFVICLLILPKNIYFADLKRTIVKVSGTTREGWSHFTTGGGVSWVIEPWRVVLDVSDWDMMWLSTLSTSQLVCDWDIPMAT